MSEGAVGPYPCDFPPLEAPLQCLDPSSQQAARLQVHCSTQGPSFSFAAEVWVLFRERSFVNKLMGRASLPLPPACRLWPASDELSRCEATLRDVLHLDFQHQTASTVETNHPPTSTSKAHRNGRATAGTGPRCG